MKKAIIAVALASFVSGSLLAVPLGDYFESVASVLPNKLDIYASQEIGFTDNSDEDYERRSSIFSKTELTMDFLRELDNGFTYGLTGGFGYEWYDSREKYKDGEFSWNFGPKFLGTLNFLGDDRLMVRLRSKSDYTRDNADTDRLRTESIGGDMIYDYNTGGHLGFAMIGSYDYTHYADDDYNDRTNNEYRLSFAPYYRISELTKVGLIVGYGERLYNSNNWQDDSATFVVNMFADYQLSGFLSIHGEAGFQRVRYDGVFGQENSAEWDPNISLAVKYKPATNVTFRFNSSYETEDTGSASRGGRNVWIQTIGMDWGLTEKTMLTQELSYDLYDEKNGEASDNGELTYKLCANYKFSDKVVFYAGYELNDVNYDYQTRRDYRANEWVLGVRCTL